MIGYTLKPDSHPLDYMLYDLDLGTIIKRTDNMVVFNVDMPAMKYIAERSVERPAELYRNAVVAKFFKEKIPGTKKFKDVLHWGKVVSKLVMKMATAKNLTSQKWSCIRV